MKPWFASAGAVVAGFIVTALASTAADAVMHAAGIFPSAPRLMSDPLFALAAAYRALFTIAGGYVAARLALDLLDEQQAETVLTYCGHRLAEAVRVPVARNLDPAMRSGERD